MSTTNVRTMLSFYRKNANQDVDFPPSTELSLTKMSENKKCLLWIYGSKCDHCKQMCAVWEKVRESEPAHLEMHAFDAHGKDKHNIIKTTQITQIPAFITLKNGKINKTEIGPRTYEELVGLQ